MLDFGTSNTLLGLLQKGLKAAMALKRLRGLLPNTARRLFEATVAPTVDYASSVWMHTCSIDRPVLNRIQRIGA